MPPSTVVGRDREAAVLTGLVDDATRHGSALVVRGEAGVGKSTLLDLAARRAGDAGLAVLRVTGVESEAQVPFSGLHRLLRPVLDHARALPPRQRDALLAAFGLAEPVAEPYLVGYAALELLADAAAGGGLLVVVDDVQWLDPPSASALAFVARRVELEPVVVLFALRDGHDSAVADGSLPELAVTALTARDAAVVLDEEAPDLPERAREQVLDLAAGNPLALVELARAWSADDHAWAATDEDALTDPAAPGALPARLERAFARRVTALEGAVRDAVLVAAASDSDDLGEVVRAAEDLTGAPGEDLVATAAAAGVLVVEETKVRFRHPLLRSACYRGAPPSRRRAAHAALAHALAAAPERRAWHRASSVVGPAEAVAADLEHVADRALLRGSARLAARALVRAAELSPPGTERGRRLTTAAGLAFEAGLHVQGADLLRRAAQTDLRDEDRLRISWLTEWFGDPHWSGAEKVRALCDVAVHCGTQGRRERALQMVLNVALRCWWANPDDETTRTLLETVDALALSPDDPRVVTVLGYGAPVERGREVVERIAAVRPDSLEQPADALNLGTAATGVGAFPLAAPLLDDAVERLRARGDAVRLVQGLVAHMVTDFHLGRWHAARASAGEVRRLAVDTAQPMWGMAGAATEAMVAAAQGDRDAELLAREAEAFFVSIGAATFLAPVAIARGLAASSHGRHEEALAHLRRVWEPQGQAYHRYARHWAALDLVTSAVALDRRDEARAVVDEVAAVEARSGWPLLGAVLATTRPLVAADDEDAEALFLAGLSGDLRAWPFLHARHLLAFGTWLRRRRRVRDSRPHLRCARDVFGTLGATPWYEQAARELRATGEAAGERPTAVDDALSPQERHIARLAAAGLSNREIGQHLYLSHRTVGSHLYRIFPKLGVTSRAQLAALLLDGARPEGLDVGRVPVGDARGDRGGRRDVDGLRA